MADTVRLDHLHIRPAVVGDLDAIVRLLADDAFACHYESYASPLPPSYAEGFAEIAADPNNKLVVVECAGAVIGVLQLTIIPGISFQGRRRAQIESVRVDRRYRCQGVGTQLVTWAIEQARQRGCRLIQLTSHHERTAAHRFYERLGFRASHVGMKLTLSE